MMGKTTCLRCWHGKEECSKGSIAGCCPGCRPLSSSPRYKMEDINLFNHELVRTLGLSLNAHLCHSESTLTLTRGNEVGTTLQLPLPPVSLHSFHHQPSLFYDELDLKLAATYMPEFNGVASSSVNVVRYMSVFCPTTLNVSDDTCDISSTIGLFLLSRLDTHFWDAFRSIDVLKHGADPRRRKAALAELAVLHCFLEDTLPALEKGRIQPLVRNPAFVGHFVERLRKIADTLRPHVFDSCSKGDEWWTGLGSGSGIPEQLRFENWASALHIRLDCCRLSTTHSLASAGLTNRMGTELTGDFCTSFASVLPPVTDKPPEALFGILSENAVLGAGIGGGGDGDDDSISLHQVGHVPCLSTGQHGVNYPAYQPDSTHTDFLLPPTGAPFVYGSSRDYDNTIPVSRDIGTLNLAPLNYFPSPQHPEHLGRDDSQTNLEPLRCILQQQQQGSPSITLNPGQVPVQGTCGSLPSHRAGDLNN